MDFKRKKSAQAVVINIASMVDVLFILLIFVLVSTTFTEQPVLNIELPGARNAGMGRIQSLVVSISKGGGIYLNGSPVDKNNLAVLLKEAVKKDKDTKAVLKADKNASYGIVIEVMDIMRGAGIKRLAAITRPAE